mmetsp:Transcript_9707/g.58875  ORF Transcript_9707/g.58875 Transcript_9707/m.58875 type:complete len:201 (+) Transcript_9707:4580-5182(+)
MILMVPMIRFVRSWFLLFPFGKFLGVHDCLTHCLLQIECWGVDTIFFYPLQMESECGFFIWTQGDDVVYLPSVEWMVHQHKIHRSTLWIGGDFFFHFEFRCFHPPPHGIRSVFAQDATLLHTRHVFAWIFHLVHQQLPHHVRRGVDHFAVLRFWHASSASRLTCLCHNAVQARQLRTWTSDGAQLKRWCTARVGGRIGCG